MERNRTVEVMPLEQIRDEVLSWPGAIALFQLSYERAVAARRPDGGNEAP